MGIVLRKNFIPKRRNMNDAIILNLAKFMLFLELRYMLWIFSICNNFIDISNFSVSELNKLILLWSLKLRKTKGLWDPVSLICLSSPITKVHLFGQLFWDEFGVLRFFWKKTKICLLVNTRLQKYTHFRWEKVPHRKSFYIYIELEFLL